MVEYTAVENTVENTDMVEYIVEHTVSTVVKDIAGFKKHFLNMFERFW